VYFGSLNEILGCLVCIINIVRFEFQFQTLLFKSRPFGTSVELDFLAYKCAQLNSLVCRSSPQGILENLSDFFPEGLDPLKFIEDSNIESVLRFLT
jgi:hypothetical protein